MNIDREFHKYKKILIYYNILGFYDIILFD